MGMVGPHFPETIERLREHGRAQFATSESRRAHGELTKQKMAAASPWAADLRRLKDAWGLACPNARTRFLAELHAPICGGVADE